jgi:hypothetical protein
MDSASLRASRWTRESHRFPTVIKATDKALIRHKRFFLRKDEISISMAKLASLHIKTEIVWPDIRIESSGSIDPLASHGHTKADACRIREMAEETQAIFIGPEILKLS